MIRIIIIELNIGFFLFYSLLFYLLCSMLFYVILCYFMLFYVILCYFFLCIFFLIYIFFFPFSRYFLALHFFFAWPLTVFSYSISTFLHYNSWSKFFFFYSFSASTSVRLFC